MTYYPNPHNPKDPLNIPAFLERREFFQVVAVDGGEPVRCFTVKGAGELYNPAAPRVWAPIRSVQECTKRDRRPPMYPDHPELPVVVVIGSGLTATTLQQHPDFATFSRLHDFKDYPFKRIATLGGATYIQVSQAIWVTKADGVVTKVSAPRAAGTRDLIWKRADELWAAAGKPMDAKVVLQLRKEWMNILEKEGIKRTTCSSEFGNWQKERLK